MTVDLEKELRENKIAIIKLLAQQMVGFKFNEYKDYKIEEDKPIPYYDATIDILKRNVEHAREGQAKLVSFDKLEKERKNLTPEEFKKLQEEQEKINKKVDSFLATFEPRASLRGNIQAPNTILIRFRGHGIDKEFSEKYPFGVLM